MKTKTLVTGLTLLVATGCASIPTVAIIEDTAKKAVEVVVEEKHIVAEPMPLWPAGYVKELSGVDDISSLISSSPLPVVVDFYATWCGPCKELAPIYDKAARAYAGMMSYARVNVEKEPAFKRALGVTSYPTILVFNKGEVACETVGFSRGRERKLRAFFSDCLEKIRK